MSTTQNTNTQQSGGSSMNSTGSWANAYNPTSMAAYNAFMPQFQSGMTDYAQNPMQSMFFQNLLGQAQKQIGQSGQTQQNTMLNNMRSSGVSTNSPFAMSQMNMQSRNQSGQQNNAFVNLLQQANQLRYGALQTMGGYNPLITGGSSSQSQSGTNFSNGNTQQTTSGLGSWLPQLLSSGLGMASGFMGGGAGKSSGSSPYGSMAGYSPFTATGAMNFASPGFNVNSLQGSSLMGGQSPLQPQASSNPFLG